MLPDITQLMSDNLAWVAAFGSIVAVLVGLKHILKPLVDTFVARDHRLVEVERGVATVADDISDLKCTSQVLLEGVLLLLERAEGNGELTECRQKFRQHLINR